MSAMDGGVEVIDSFASRRRAGDLVSFTAPASYSSYGELDSSGRGSIMPQGLDTQLSRQDDRLSVDAEVMS